MIWNSVITKAGMARRTLDDIRQSMHAVVAEIDPTIDLLSRSPQQSFIDTSVAAINECWQMIGDLFNSLTPYNANGYFLEQIAALHGIQRNELIRPSVYVTFTGTAGFVIPAGAVVGDGGHQYQVVTGGIVSNGGAVTLYCRALDDGIWAIPAYTVNQVLFSVYSPNTLTCANQAAGNSGSEPESLPIFRERVLRDYRKTSSATIYNCRALLQRVDGVITRSVAIRKYMGSVKVMVAGGDPNNIGYAIYKSGIDVSRLSGSTSLGHSIERNRHALIQEYPDFYNIVFVHPVEKLIKINVFWNTHDHTFIRDMAIIAACQMPIVDYINQLPTGGRINLLELDNIFRDAASAVINPQFISNLRFQVIIDGIIKGVDNGTHLISDDAEALFSTNADSVRFSRG
jgi:hypothetical protein